LKAVHNQEQEINLNAAYSKAIDELKAKKRVVQAGGVTV